MKCRIRKNYQSFLSLKKKKRNLMIITQIRILILPTGAMIATKATKMKNFQNIFNFMHEEMNKKIKVKSHKFKKIMIKMRNKKVLSIKISL